MQRFSEKVSFIWSVADLLRGDFKQSEYGRVILPFTVLRRLDQVLAPTRQAVRKAHTKYADSPEALRELGLEDVRDIWLVFPPAQEQASLLNELDSHLDSIIRITTSLSKQIDRLREYRQALITAAVTGQLDIPEATT